VHCLKSRRNLRNFRIDAMPNKTPLPKYYPPFHAIIMFNGITDNLRGKNSRDFAGYKIVDSTGGEIMRVKTPAEKDKMLTRLKAKYGNRRIMRGDPISAAGISVKHINSKRK
jgi:hypothetical protein